MDDHPQKYRVTDNVPQEMEPIPALPRNGLRRNIWRYFREHNDASSIQGLRYITEKRSTTEKLLWCVILLISVSCCLYMIYEIWNKYENGPVVVSFATKDTPIYDIPFPAITICPKAKSSQTINFNYTEVNRRLENHELVDEAEMRQYNYMRLLCTNKVKDEARGIDTMEQDFYETIDQWRIKLDDLMLYCEFMGEQLPCNQLFLPSITDQGVCYSFNILDRHKLFRDHIVHYNDFSKIDEDSSHFDGETGYDRGAGIYTYPKRALLSGSKNSLKVLLSQNRAHLDYLCQPFHGFTVLLHNPYIYPRLSSHTITVPLEKFVIAAIDPALILTSANVAKMSPSKRKCFLRSERALKYYKIYTQTSCYIECQTSYMLKKCGCVAFFMPRDNQTKICGSAKVECMKKAEDELKIKNLESKLIAGGNLAKGYCDCKPLCTNLRYDTETLLQEWNGLEYLRANNMDSVVHNKMDLSMLSVYFKYDQFMTLERQELYGVSDLISNFGGLLGLFTGFSLITMVEIIYFLTLRLFCNKRLYGHWAGANK